MPRPGSITCCFSKDKYNIARIRTFNQSRKQFREMYEIIKSKYPSAHVSIIYRDVANMLREFTKMTYMYREMYYDFRERKRELSLVEESLKKCYNEFERFAKAKVQSKIDVYFDEENERLVRTEVKRKQQGLKNMQNKVNKMEQELIIRQEDLQTRIQDTNLALSSYYHLSDDEIELFEHQRDKILKGVEKWGNISLACQKDRTITMKVSSILHYAQKHNQFKQDIEIAKQVFKDNLDSVLLDRAMNGTVNPVFQKGEYIGDYAVKDNKLLVEVAKAKLPETYNPKVVADQSACHGGGTTINIVSFDGVDETKFGYARDIGVVKAVDDTGRVERITQRNKEGKKMLDFYKSKGDTEIVVDVEPEPTPAEKPVQEGD